jgi:predicted nucleotidyltransferase component of viral defense system
MNEHELSALALAQGIDLSTVLHEEREVRFLADIAADPVLALHLVFKGGTALRLVYLCDRYSDDLDFDLVRRDAAPKEILQRLETVARRGQLEITDAWVKRRTILLEVRARGWKRRLKIEVSSLDRPAGNPTLVRNIVSPVFPASANVLTYPLSILLSGKMRAAARTVRTRALVRDRRILYARLKQSVSAYPEAQIRSELGALLPRAQRMWASGQLKERTQELLELRLGGA